MPLTEKQKLYVERYYRKRSVAEIESALKVTGVAEYLKEKGYPTYSEIRYQMRGYGTKDYSKVQEGFFDVNQHRNWLIDDGTSYGKSY